MLLDFSIKVARRLTKSQKAQIVEGYREGKPSITLAKEFSCSANTVIRTIKAMISSQEYLALKESKLKYRDKLNKTSLKKTGELENCILIEENDNLKNSDLDEKNLPIAEVNNLYDNLNKESFESDTFEIDKDKDSSSIFKEVAPLITDFGFEEREQKVNCKKLEPGLLPEIVYILVDKKVELERVHLNDLPDWDFLPDSEKEREVIPLFINQREAKRNCSRSQRVIKIPDSNLFITTRSYLLAKGISRLVFEDSLIALDD